MPSIRKRWPSHISLFIYSNRNRRWSRKKCTMKLFHWPFELLDVSLSEIYVSQNSDFFSLSLFRSLVECVFVYAVYGPVSHSHPIRIQLLLLKIGWNVEKKCAEYCVRKGNAKNDPIFSTQPFIHCAVYCIRYGGHSAFVAVRSSPYTNFPHNARCLLPVIQYSIFFFCSSVCCLYSILLWLLVTVVWISAFADSFSVFFFFTRSKFYSFCRFPSLLLAIPYSSKKYKYFNSSTLDICSIGGSNSISLVLLRHLACLICITATKCGTWFQKKYNEKAQKHAQQSRLILTTSIICHLIYNMHDFVSTISCAILLSPLAIPRKYPNSEDAPTPPHITYPVRLT